MSQFNDLRPTTPSSASALWLAALVRGKRGRGGLAWCCLATLMALLFPATAAGQGTEGACVAAYETSQELRVENKLAEALAQAEFCANEPCPSVIRSGCTKWMVELREQQPTVVFTARVGNEDVSDVAVYVDDARVLTELTGQPIPLDPGTHKVRFTRAGDEPIEKSVVVTIGVKNRIVQGLFEAPVTAPASPADAPVEEPGAPTAALIAGGFGLAFLGVFAGLAVTGTSEVNELRDTCGVARTCADEDVESAKTKIIVGDVFLIAGGASLAVATGLLIAHYASSGDTTSSSWRWSVAPTLAGATGVLIGAF